jgi:hypothetical protein
MNPKCLIIGIVAITACTAAIGAEAGPETSLQAATSIVFRVSRKDTKEFTVDSPAQVASLTSVIRLNPKPPCLCIHHESAVFASPSGTLNVSFCDHCFDVNRVSYAMPKEFYARYKQLTPKNW